MTRTAWGWVVLGTVVGFLLGEAWVLYGAWAAPASAVWGEPAGVRNGFVVLGMIGAVLGACIGAAAGVAADWWPAGDQRTVSSDQ